MIYKCRKCKYQTDDEIKFCRRCGAESMEALSDEDVKQINEERIREERLKFSPHKCTKCAYESDEYIKFCKRCGAQSMEPDIERKYIEPSKQVIVKQVSHNNIRSIDDSKLESYFDGGLFELIGWTILGGIVTFLTFGLCYPWALCMVYGWKINHTVINGRRLVFKGSAFSLFGNWIIWMILTVITLGIYGFWVGIALEKWKVKNTEFAS